MAGRPIQDSGVSSATTPSLTRASPFASSPVATVNQAHPRFCAPGQFPGDAVRATPTQLSTPLVPQRHLSFTSNSSEIPLPIFNDVGWQSSHPEGMGGRSIRTVQPRDQSVANSEVLEGGKEPLSLTFAPQLPIQQDNNESLICRPEKLSTPSIPTLSRHSSLTMSQSLMHSTVSKSPPPPSQSRASQQCATYQQQSPARSFGHAPPPAVPFSGSLDNSRSQSARVPVTPTPTLVSMYSDAQNISPVRSVSLATSSTSHQTTLKAPSANKLIDEFMKISVDERFAGFKVADPLVNKVHLQDVNDTLDDLEALYAQKRWNSLTMKSLSMLQNPTNDMNVTLEIKSWWLAGLIKEGQYDNAASVLDQVGNLDEIVLLDGGSSFVLIRLYLLQALLSKCQGKFSNHEKQLFHLISRLKSAIQQNTTKNLLNIEINVAARWLRIAQFALTNHFVSQQKFTRALGICSQIDEYYLDGQDKVIVLSRVGRIRLQMGDLKAAEILFEAARYYIDRLKMGSGDGTAVAAEILCALEAQMLMNNGLLFFAQNKLQEALSAFDSVLYIQNALILTADGADADLFLDEDVVCSAVNNYAICALYCCDVKAAVAALEQMIRSNPRRFLNGVVVFNLSSLYDLLFDNATSKSRKEMIKKIAHMYDLEHIDPATYRI